MFRGVGLENHSAEEVCTSVSQRCKFYSRNSAVQLIMSTLGEIICSYGMFNLRMKRSKFCQSFVSPVTFLQTFRGVVCGQVSDFFATVFVDHYV